MCRSVVERKIYYGNISNDQPYRGGKYKLKSVTRETLTKGVPKQFVPSVNGNFIIVAGGSRFSQIITLDGITFNTSNGAAGVASRQYVEFNAESYISAKSFIEVTVQEGTYENSSVSIYEYEPID